MRDNEKKKKKVGNENQEVDKQRLQTYCLFP